MSIAFAKPFNQKIRIVALRLTFAALIPVVAVGGSRWDTMPAISGLLETLGIFAILIAVLGRFWSILYIGGRKNAAVMQDGPYSICRHPLYLFSTIGTAGFGLMMGSVFTALFLGAVAFLILSLTAEREEAYLRQTFGPKYDAYASRVPRMLPALRLFRTPLQVAVDVGTLSRNAADALVFAGLIPLAELLKYLQAVHVIPTLHFI